MLAVLQLFRANILIASADSTIAFVAKYARSKRRFETATVAVLQVFRANILIAAADSARAFVAPYAY